MTEKWRKYLRKGGAFGAILTDIFRALDCLPHELLITKRHVYRVDLSLL